MLNENLLFAYLKLIYLKLKSKPGMGGKQSIKDFAEESQGEDKVPIAVRVSAVEWWINITVYLFKIKITI